MAILLFISSAFIGCQVKEAKTAVVQRDTSITPETSFSRLFLDSAQLELFIKEQRVGDNPAKHIHEFYTSRNYEFAWFTEDGIAEHTLSFWNLHNNYIEAFSDTALKYKPLHHQIDLLINEETASPITAAAMLLTELQLTKHFFEYSSNAYAGKVDPQKLKWHIPRKKINAVLLLDSLLAREGKDLESWEPVNLYYQKLKKELLHYSAIARRGGWKEVFFKGSKQYKPGDSAVVIKGVKMRLQASGENKDLDTTVFYSTGLIVGVKASQRSFGLKQDGVITAELIKHLNVSVKSRIRQLLINLERMRWVPEPSGDLIIVNIPEFKLHVFEGAMKLFSIDIVVGKEGHNTVIFTGNLKHVVFSPYWNVPPSIVRNEILTAIRKNGNYLATMNMEQKGMANGLPVIRQKPGGANALGKVKFIFPNSYNIYFHDTPVKSLFKEERRAFSHGCIRLAEPKKLAAYLLRKQPEWTEQKMNGAMSVPVEEWVAIKDPLPVFITYFTAWVDSEGSLNFRDDIYGHDKKLATHLFGQ